MIKKSNNIGSSSEFENGLKIEELSRSSAQNGYELLNENHTHLHMYSYQIVTFT